MLALVARTGEKLDSVKKEIEHLGGNAIGIPADLTKDSEVEAMVNKVLEKFGRIDLLVNSAFWGPPGSLEQTTEEFLGQDAGYHTQSTFSVYQGSCTPYEKAGWRQDREYRLKSWQSRGR